jgi:LAO/AO transport system kinase
MAPALSLVDKLVAGIGGSDRASLAKAITLVESRRPDHQGLARDLVQRILPRTGGACRVGITGAPGVGKSTMIEALGSMLAGRGHRIAVLAVDPSSQRTGGSILGDKTRMTRLSADPNAFIRPSPSAGTLGGVAAKTRETMLLCEAAGFDVVIVETVGVGQSETAVADLVDVFLVLMEPGAGDELQGLKKGVLELADMIVVSKADGDGMTRARETASQYGSALRILSSESSRWVPPVLIASAVTSDGLGEIWSTVLRYRSEMRASGAFDARRRSQQVRWMRRMIEERLTSPLREDARVKRRLAELEAEVAEGRLAPSIAVEEIAAMLAGGR